MKTFFALILSFDNLKKRTVIVKERRDSWMFSSILQKYSI